MSAANYQHILLLALRMNILLHGLKPGPFIPPNRLSAEVTAEEIPGTVNEVNSLMRNNSAAWVDFEFSANNRSFNNIPAWDDASGSIRLVTPLGAVVELELTVRGMGRVSLKSLTALLDGDFPRNGKNVLQGRNTDSGYSVKFCHRNGTLPKLQELGSFVESAMTLATYDEGSRDLFEMMATALRPFN